MLREGEGMWDVGVVLDLSGGELENLVAGYRVDEGVAALGRKRLSREAVR